MEPSSVVFLGSKEIGYSCLEYLLKNQRELNIIVVGVLTKTHVLNKGTDIAKLADLYDVPILVDLDEMMCLPKVDFIFSVQFHQILRETHIKKARILCVNLHMAPLPEYRGCNQFSFAIFNGDSTFGTTLHRLETGIDSGAIIAEERFSIPLNCTVHDLYQKTVEMSFSLFKGNAKKIFANEFELKDQSSFFGERSSGLYYRSDIEKIKKCNLSMSSEEINRRYRASFMKGFLPPSIMVGNEEYYIIKKCDYEN